MNRLFKGKVLLSSLFFLSVTPAAFGNAGSISVSATSVTFGNVVPNVSPPAQKSITLKNLGSVSVSVSAINVTGTNEAEFTISGITLPKTLLTNQSITFVINFTPVANNTAYSATVAVVSSATNSPTDISVTGEGFNHRCILNWTESATPSDEVAGYNIYRATSTDGVCGSFEKVNASLITGLTYTDQPLVGGTTYCYVGTAVGAGSLAGMESAYSTPTTIATVPSP